MTNQDIEFLAVDLARVSGILGAAQASQLRPHICLLKEVQEEINHALERAERSLVT